MKRPVVYVVQTLVSGLLIVIPIYLAVLLLLKGMGSVVGLARPFDALKTISRWGSGAADLLAAMDKGKRAAV